MSLVFLTGAFGTAADAQSLSRPGHIFVVVEENTAYSSIIANPSLPYLNSLAKQYGLATNYYANTHPSIGNYFALTTGQIITNQDNYSNTVSVDNIARHLISAKKTWKEYSSGIPFVGYTGVSTGSYSRHHNPFSFFSDVRNVPAQLKNLVSTVQLKSDITNGALPNFGFIVPANNQNGHDGNLPALDSWLKANIAPLIASAQFRQDGLLIVVFDESYFSDTVHGGGQIAWIAVGPAAKPAYTSSTFYQHASTLKFVSDLLGIGSPIVAANAPTMTEFIANTATPTPTPTPTPTATPSPTATPTPSPSPTATPSPTPTATPPPPPPPTPTISPSPAVGFSDDFHTSVLDTTKWYLGLLNADQSKWDLSVQVSQPNGTLQIAPLSNTAGYHYNGYVSTRSSNLTGGNASIEIVQATRGPSMFLVVGIDQNNWYRIALYSGSLLLQEEVNGIRSSAGIGYDATQHRFWRIRHDALSDQILFETSPERATWTVQRQIARRIPITALKAAISAGTQGPWVSPGTAIFDNFQLVTGSGVTPPPPPPPTPTATPVNFRIAISADGNNHDRDDICATAMNIAELANTGNQKRLVHYDYADHYWITSASREEEMRISAVETAKVWGGFDLSIFYNSTQLRSMAVTHLVGEINKSSANDRLKILGLGPMQIIGLAVAQSDPVKRQYVTLVSHSIWNDTHAASSGPGEGLIGATYSYSNIGGMGVNLLHIVDQNAGINKPYDQYFWLRDSLDPKLRWLWDRGQAAGKTTFDCSDAGETYFVLTGDQYCTPLKLRSLLGAGP